jgi:hypothetical protein
LSSDCSKIRTEEGTIYLRKYTYEMHKSYRTNHEVFIKT